MKKDEDHVKMRTCVENRDACSSDVQSNKNVPI